MNDSSLLSSIQQKILAGDLDAATSELAEAPPGAVPLIEQLSLRAFIASLRQDWSTAVELFTSALALHPDAEDLVHNLRQAQQAQARQRILAAARLIQTRHYTEAIPELRESLSVLPDYSEAWHDLGLAYCAVGAVEAAATAWQRCARAGLQQAKARSMALLALEYSERVTPARLYVEHQAVGLRVEALVQSQVVRPDEPLPSQFLTSSSLGRRKGRLRVGYLSNDLRHHALFRFFEPLLRHHSREAVELHCFHAVEKPDHLTARARALSAGWHDLNGLSDADAAQRIADAHLDILVDLQGHTGVRPWIGVLAYQCAPVQMTAIGYPGSTGLSRVQWRWGDSLADPPDAEREYTEQVLSLDPCFLCFSPPEEIAPPVAPPPQLRNGFVTFGSFNSRAKLSPSCLDLWAEVLLALPESRLLLKCVEMDDPLMRDALRARFVEKGIAPERIELRLPAETYPEHLAQYGDVDIALDSSPYQGTTTTCEALWMGVPVVSLQGQRHAARVGASLLSAAGLPEGLAWDRSQFVELALRCARQERAWEEQESPLRRSMRRERLRGSVLLDGRAYAARVERALRSV